MEEKKQENKERNSDGYLMPVRVADALEMPDESTLYKAYPGASWWPHAELEDIEEMDEPALFAVVNHPWFVLVKRMSGALRLNIALECRIVYIFSRQTPI